MLHDILWMIPRLIAPPGDIGDELRRKGLAVGNLYGPLAGLISLQPRGERLDGLRPGIQAHMLLESRKMDDIVLLPESRHAPGKPLLGIRQGGAYGIPHLVQIRSRLLRLGSDIFVNGIRGFPAVMTLFLSLKSAAALGAFPHF